MGKASNRKTKQELPKLSQQPWGESNVWIWGPFSLFLAVVGLVVQMNGGLRWLLWLGPPIATIPIWHIAKNLTKPDSRIEIFWFFLIPLVCGTYLIYKSLEPPPPIAISPLEIPISHLFYSQAEKGYVDIGVYNRSDDPYSQIWVKLLVTSKVITEQEIDIDFPTIEEREKAGKNVNDMASGTMCVGGRDKDNLSSFICRIDTLDPREIFKIQVSGLTSKGSDVEKALGTISTKVLKFTDDPSSHFQRRRGRFLDMGTQSTTPEPFHPTTMIHFCPKNSAEEFHSIMPVTCTKRSMRRETKS